MATEPKVSISRALEILGLSAGASKDDIKRAYKNLARVCHPDKNSQPDATEKFQELSNAYRTLKSHDGRSSQDDSYDDGDWSSCSDDEDCPYYFDDKELFFILLQDLLFRRRFSYTPGPFGFAEHSQDNSHSNYFRPRRRETSYDQFDEKYDKWEKQPKPSTGTRCQQEEPSSNNRSSQAGFSYASTSYSHKYDQVNDDEDAELYDFLKRERRAEEGDDEDLDPDEVVKKYKSYEEWKKAKKQKKKLKLPPKPRPLTKRQQQNQQFRRDKEMQEIQVELLKMNLEVEEKEKSRREKEEIKKMEEEVADVQSKKLIALEMASIPEQREKKEEKKRKPAKKRDVGQDENQRQILERQRELERQRNLNEMQKIQEAEAERRRNTMTHRTNQAHQRQYVNSSVKRQKFNATHQSQTSVPKQNQPPASKPYDSVPDSRSNNLISPLETPRPPADNAWLQGPPLIATADGTVQAKVAPLVPAPNTPEEEEEMLRRAIELSMKEQIEQQEYLLNLCHNVESVAAVPDSGLWDIKDSDEGDCNQKQPLPTEYVKADDIFSQKENKDIKASFPHRTSKDFTRYQHRPCKTQKWPPPKEENWDEEIADFDTPSVNESPKFTSEAASCDWANTGARPKSRFHNRNKTTPAKWNVHGHKVAAPLVEPPEVFHASEECNSEISNNSEIKLKDDSHVKIEGEVGSAEEVSWQNLDSVELTSDDVQVKDEGLYNKEVCVGQKFIVPTQNPLIVNCEATVPTPLDSEQVTSDQLQLPKLVQYIVSDQTQLPKLTQPVVGEQSQLPSPLDEPIAMSSFVSGVPHQLNPEHCKFESTEQAQMPSKAHEVVNEGSQLLNGSSQLSCEQSHTPNISQVRQVEHSSDTAKVNVSTTTGFTDNHMPLPHMPPYPDKMAGMFYEQGGGMGLPFMGSMPNIGMVPVPGIYNPYLSGASNPLLQYLQSMNMVYGGLPSPIGALPPFPPFPGITPVTPVHVNPYMNYAFSYPPISNMIQNSNITNEHQFTVKNTGFSSTGESDSVQVPGEEVITESSQIIPSVNSCSAADVVLKDMTYQSDDDSESDGFSAAAVTACQNTTTPTADSDSKREVYKATASVNSDCCTVMPGSEHNTSRSSYSHIPPINDHSKSPPMSAVSSTLHKESNSIDSKVNVYAKPFPSAVGRGNHHPVRLRGCLRARGARRNEPFSHQRSTYTPNQPTTAVHGVCSNTRPQFKSPYYEAEDTRAHRTKTAVFGSQKNQDNSVSKKGGHS